MATDTSQYRKGYLAAFACVCFVVLTQAWVISAGRMTSWPQYSIYYGLLADAFLHGQTNLLLHPGPELLALSDPYDPAVNGEYRLSDALLYHGKFYLYWGPVPALLLAPVKWITEAEIINDAYLVFAFTVGLSVFSALLILTLWRRLFFDLPWWAIIPGILVVGLGTPIPFLLGRPAIYEAAIASGQCFLIGGIYWAFTAFESERLSTWKLLLAGICWTFAVGSRVSLVLAVVMLSFLVVLRIWRKEATRSTRRLRVRGFASFGAPLAIGAVSLALYNYVRFGSWSEMGVQYQMAGINIHAIFHAYYTSTAYVLPNLFSYLLRPLSVDSVFPFVYAKTGNDAGAYPAFISKLPYDVEPVAGILLTSPFVWFALVSVTLLIRQWWKARRAHGRKDTTQEMAYSLSWIVLGLSGAAPLCMAPTLLIMGPTMRYLADSSPSLTILATLGVWQGYSLLKSKPLARRVWISLASGVALLSIIFSVLLAVTSYYGHFKNNNPELFNRLKYWTAQDHTRSSSAQDHMALTYMNKAIRPTDSLKAGIDERKQH